MNQATRFTKVCDTQFTGICHYLMCFSFFSSCFSRIQSWFLCPSLINLTQYLKGITCNIHFPVSGLLLNSDWMKCVQIIVKHIDVLYHIALVIKTTRHSGQVLQWFRHEAPYLWYKHWNEWPRVPVIFKCFIFSSQLLIPHVRYTIAINTAAREKLINESGVFEKVSLTLPKHYLVRNHSFSVHVYLLRSHDFKVWRCVEF